MGHLFPFLFSPIKLGEVEVPNRICFSAHTTNFAIQGLIHERHIAYYEERAKGAVASSSWESSPFILLIGPMNR
jgi:2,4-dienoyl-CoA reductase-like NADH-dependent reductase (Old Yellow Enzyme family)